MKRQIIVLEVVYEEEEDYVPPNEWDWSDLAGEYDVQCIGCGPVTDPPFAMLTCHPDCGPVTAMRMTSHQHTSEDGSCWHDNESGEEA